jgi:hypothetical protein
MQFRKGIKIKDGAFYHFDSILARIRTKVFSLHDKIDFWIPKELNL